MATLGRPTFSGGSVGGNLIQYMGYIGKIEYDDEAGLFHGEVITTRDVITFQGTCVEELRQAFKESIEDYLEFCAERGEEPEKPFSGKLLLRINPELHRRITIEAKKEDLSINQWVAKTIEKAFA
jgi:predicted HicB family RNase H-like nuclease